MKTVGLITEYNPFHNGHLYHLEEAKKITGADFAVVVMSGNFLQRGVPAITGKWERAEMALRNGADLVIELPVCYSTGSAEFFSSGAIAALDKLGITDSLCFGSECGDAGLLSEIAHILADEPEGYKERLKLKLKSGMSFPSARSAALMDYLSSDPYFSRIEKSALEDTVSNPNNILGVEYIKALIKRKSSIVPYTIKRIGSGYHDAEIAGRICSATSIRNSLLQKKEIGVIRGHVPESVFKILEHMHMNSFPIFEDDFSALLKYQLLLKRSRGEDIAECLDVSRDLAARIYNNLDRYTSFSQFASLLKSREVTHSRITRSFIHILLDIREKDVRSFISEDYMEYARMLGFRKNSTALLGTIKERGSAQLLTKPAQADRVLSPLGMKMLRQDMLASDIYNSVAADKFSSAFINEYTREVIRI